MNENKVLNLYRFSRGKPISLNNSGPVVQLVRIHACHAWGRGFEPRPDRQKPRVALGVFYSQKQRFCCVR